jgi:hypothetical protein
VKILARFKLNRQNKEIIQRMNNKNDHNSIDLGISNYRNLLVKIVNMTDIKMLTDFTSTKLYAKTFQSSYLITF